MSSAQNFILFSRRSISSFSFARLAFNEVLADRALLQSVSFGELAYGFAVFPRGQAEHEFFPNRLRQRLAPVEQFVGSQPDLPVVGRTNARPFDRNLLPHHHAVAALGAPPIRFPLRRRPAALTDQSTHFLVHEQSDQLQSGLANQFPHSLAQPADHLGHRQHHLYRRISFRGHLFEPLHGSLRFDLIWFLH